MQIDKTQQKVHQGRKINNSEKEGKQRKNRKITIN
jgi:hypothetical protein